MLPHWGEEHSVATCDANLVCSRRVTKKQSAVRPAHSKGGARRTIWSAVTWHRFALRRTTRRERHLLLEPNSVGPSPQLPGQLALWVTGLVPLTCLFHTPQAVWPQAPKVNAMARAAAMAIRFTAPVALLVAAGVIAPVQAQDVPTSDPIARIAGATEGWSLYFENGQWMRRNLATGKVEPLPAPPDGDPKETGAWRLLEFNFNPAASSNWSVRLSMPNLVQLPRGEIDGILGGELSAWPCEPLRGRGLRCTSPSGWNPPAGAWLALSIDGSRFEEWSAQPITDLATRLRTPRQAVRGEVDSSPAFALILLSPMVWNQAQLAASLELTFDGQAQAFELERSLLEERTEIEWRLEQPPFVPMTNPVQTWRQPAVAAWRLSTPEPPRHGQQVQLRLVDPGMIANFVSPLLFDWQRPRVLGVASNCPDGRSPARPSCNDQPRLYFDDRPGDETLQLMIDALPLPLYAYASQFGAERDATRSRKVWSLPLHGAERDTNYRIDWPAQAAELEGRPIEPASYTLSIGAHQHATPPRVGPRLLSLRRGEASPWRWMANAHARASLAVDHFRLGAQRQQVEFTQPVAADPLALQRVMLPLDVEQVGWSTIRRYDSHASVADFGLHAVQFKDELMLVATEFSDGAPIAGVEVTLRRDGQTHNAETDDKGIARVPGTWLIESRISPPVDEPPMLVEALHSGRGALLRLRPTMGPENDVYYFHRSDAEVDALWWTDSDRYAPGQPLRFRLLARRSESLPQVAGAGAPVKASLLAWNVVVDEAMLEEDARGGVHGEFQIPDYPAASKQTWRLRLDWPDGTQLWHVVQNVSSAAAARIDVRLDVPIGPLLAGERVEISALARWADGTPAVGVPLLLQASQARLSGEKLMASPSVDGEVRDSPAGDGNAGVHFVDPTAQPTAPERDSCGGLPVQVATTAADGRAVFDLVLATSCPSASWTFRVVDSTGDEPRSESVSRTMIAQRQLGVVGLPLLPVQPGRIELGALAVDLSGSTTTPPRAELLFERIDGGGKASAGCTVVADGVDRCGVELASEGAYQVLLQADGYLRNRFRLAVGVDYALSLSPTEPLTLMRPRAQGPQSHLANGEAFEFRLQHSHAQVRLLLTLADDELRVAQWLPVPEHMDILRWQPPAGLSGCYRLAVLVVPFAPEHEPLPQVRLIGEDICLQPPPAELIRVEGLVPRVNDGTLRLRLHPRVRDGVNVSVRVVDDRLVDEYGDSTFYSLTNWIQPIVIDGWPPRLRSTMMDGYDPTRPALEPWREVEFLDRSGEALPYGNHLMSSVAGPFPLWPALPSEVAARHPPEVAYWQPALELRRGRSRSLAIELPDYPARWRVELLAMDEEGRIQFVSHAFVAE